MATVSDPAASPDGRDDVVTALATFINGTIMAHGHPVHPDDDLEKAGVDSMAVLKILVFIESTYGFWMPDEDLVEENTASVRAFANYIRRHCTPPRGDRP